MDFEMLESGERSRIYMIRIRDADEFRLLLVVNRDWHLQLQVDFCPPTESTFARDIWAKNRDVFWLVETISSSWHRLNLVSRSFGHESWILIHPSAL